MHLPVLMVVNTVAAILYHKGQTYDDGREGVKTPVLI